MIINDSVIVTVCIILGNNTNVLVVHGDYSRFNVST